MHQHRYLESQPNRYVVCGQLLSRLINDADITLLPFPDDVMQAAEESSFELFDETAAEDADFASIFKEWSAFREAIQAWHGLAERGYLQYVGRSR